MEDSDMKLLLVPFDILASFMIEILRNIIKYYILYSVSISESVFYSSSILSNSLANLVLYDIGSTFQIIYIFFGMILLLE
ncbi:hypothetical protein IC006_1008 [Sulfuracidifex tepidarius]|uniref:Uncharacterized protein n=1 Tax=Sulfuracidifex tepidarius TaxID=1294262 RepID=A0A510E1U3_9CREN|nr:hypothetical protein IC006_1008 [Sulfuracidifex tepidarius]BBG26469.1 hypothetical protein IC007_0979 [Sulfuracidifex tepidarius]